MANVKVSQLRNINIEDPDSAYIMCIAADKTGKLQNYRISISQISKFVEGGSGGSGTITGVSANGTSVATSGVANIPAATTSKYGVTKLSDATNSSSVVLAATANAVKKAYDLANGKGTYSKPSGGIPKSDLASAVQTSLGKADTALQSYTEQYTGTITGVKANGTSIATSGVANIPAATTSKYGVTKLSDSTSSTSTVLAATANAVRQAYDLANSYKGTVTGITINGATKTPTDGIIDLGNTPTEDTINNILTIIEDNEYVTATAITDLNKRVTNLELNGSGGSSNSNVQAVDTGDVLDDVTVNYATKTYIDGLVGDINSVLESIINGGAGAGSVMPIVLNAISCSDAGNYTTSLSDNPNAKKLYEELMLLSNNTGEGNLDVGLVTIRLTSPLNSEYEQLLNVTSYSLAPAYIAEGILLYRESFYQYYVLQQDGTIQSVFYD